MQLLLWIIFAVWTAWLAKKKGRNVALWCILGFLGGFISLIIVAILPSVKKGDTYQDRLNNSQDSQEGGGLSWKNLQSQPANQNNNSPIEVPPRETCPQCGSPVSGNAKYCENCGKKLGFKFSLEKADDKKLDNQWRCGNCRQLINKTATFCPYCGTKVSS